MLKRIALAILLLPLAEIVAFVLVAALIGVAPALLLLVISTLAGFLVLRTAGRGGLARFRGTVTGSGATPPNPPADIGGFFTVLAGLLLFVPGFLTSLVGASLLAGPVQRACRDRFGRWLRRRQPSDRTVVDLDPGEWARGPDRELSSNSKPD
jgi:UPF0716 protein FxsA